MKVRAILLAAALSLVASAMALAGDCAGDHGCCDTCGNGKVCKLVVGTKDVKTVCYGCECDAVCLPCPACKGCKHCETVCGPEGDCGKCGKSPECKVKWTDWEPNGATVRNIKKLVKYEVVKKVPSYKWVVVDGCECGKDAPAGTAPTPAGDAPKPPKAATYKPAPKNARLGEVLSVSDAELKQLAKMVPAAR